MKILLFALAVFSIFQLNAQIDQEHLQIGEKAPEIQSRDQNGMIIDSKAILKETQEKFGVTYSIVHDDSNKIMNDYKVALDVNPKNVTNYYDKVYELVNEYNGPDNAVLPVPSTYLIGKDGLIEYVQYDPDYKKRSDIS